MYNTGVLVAMGIIVLRHWPPHLRLQTDPELLTSSGTEREGQYTSTVDEREKINTTESLNICTEFKMQHDGSSPESMIRCGTITRHLINWFPQAKKIQFHPSLLSHCPTSTAYCVLQMSFHREVEIRRNETEKKQDRVKQAAWVMNIS